MAALLPGAALAQANQTGEAQLPQNELPQNQTPDQTAEASIATQEQAGGEAIVVTGTLIRGIAPAGNNVIGITTEQVAASGGTTTNQILSSLPQVGNFFNALPAGVSGQSGANLSNPVSRPNLRNLPAAGTSGGAQTLVLVDGHRVVGAGITQIAVDPDILAPGVIERVEALVDGGSAVYGSDALGGVLNFITRKKFDGVQVAARYGFGDEYYTVDGSVMVGKDWGTGGIYAAYGYAHHDAIFGKDRDFVRQIDYNTLIPTGRNCAAPNVSVTAGGVATTFVPSGSGLAAGLNTCDLTDNSAIYPVNTLHTVYGKFVQDLNDSITFDVTALYASRKIRGFGGSLGTGALGSGAAGQATLCPVGSVTAACTAPGVIRSIFYRDPGGALSGLPQVVRFDYSPLLGAKSATQNTTLESWSVTPSLSFDLGGGFQLRALASYGRAVTIGRNAQISSGAQTAAINATTLNPFNVGAATATNLLQFNVVSGRNQLWDYRAIIDGPLFSIGGGDVRVAGGVEHLRTHFTTRTTNTNVVPYALNLPRDYVQKVNAVFGEVQIPLISRENEITGFNELTISGSARYDDYNDVGSTFNPKAGLTWRPVRWVAVRGNIGKSFSAPTAVDQLGVPTTTVGVVPPNFNTGVARFNPGPTDVSVFVSGTDPDIGPQKATNWSLGLELKPPFVDGLTMSASYYYIDLKGTIGRPVSGTDNTNFYAGYPSLFLVRPTGAALAAYLAQFPAAGVGLTVNNPTDTVGQARVTGSGQTNAPVLTTLDTRVRNLGNTKLSGIDFAVNYLRETSFGSIDASFAGNYKIKQKTQTEPGVNELNDLFVQSIPRLLFQATLGATIGNLRAQATLNHTSSYKRGDAFLLDSLGNFTSNIAPTAFGQTRVKSFDAVNLYFRYEVPEALVGPDLDFTLNVQNLFDVDPPVFRSATSPGYNTTGGSPFTIGRVVQFGVSKKF